MKSTPFAHSALCLLSSSVLMLAVTHVGAATPVPNAEGEVIPPDEPAAITAVTSAIQASVQAGFDKTGHAYRDAHRKAHGCVNATFTVLPGLPSKVAQGLFAQPQSYDSVIRFSNGSGQSLDDHNNDARGMALKVLGVPGTKVLSDELDAHTQDFVMTNHPVFFIRNAPDYIAFQKAVSGGALAQAGWFAQHLFYEVPIIVAFTGHKVTNPLNSRYWSATPSKLGTEQMKFSAKPCAGGTFVDTSNTANLLADNLQGQLASQSACFDFMVQTRTVPTQMPIEDPTVEWKKASSPFIPVAKILISPQTVESGEACEVRSFTPWHTLPDHRPLGGISRARKVVYQTISTLRHQLNGQPRVEP